MKITDSGMPDEAYWNSLFDIGGIIEWLAIPVDATIAEIGCGYGTFTVPVASCVEGVMYAFDIEPHMVEVARENVLNSRLENVRFDVRDVLESGTGIAPDSIDLVLLFNILHSDDKAVLLAEATRILRKGGIVAIIHWRKDIPTPRGPAVELRPDLEQIMEAAAGLGLDLLEGYRILPPYHWGARLIKVETK